MKFGLQRAIERVVSEAPRGAAVFVAMAIPRPEDGPDAARVQISSNIATTEETTKLLRRILAQLETGGLIS